MASNVPSVSMINLPNELLHGTSDLLNVLKLLHGTADLLNVLSDARLCEEQIVNYVGVQCEVQEEAEDCEFRERLRKIPLPEELMRDGHDDEEDM